MRNGPSARPLFRGPTEVYFERQDKLVPAKRGGRNVCSRVGKVAQGMGGDGRQLQEVQCSREYKTLLTVG